MEEKTQKKRAIDKKSLWLIIGGSLLGVAIIVGVVLAFLLGYNSNAPGQVNIVKLDKTDNLLYKQNMAILKKIDSVKDSAGLKKLLEKNKEAAEALCRGIYSSVENVIKSVNSDNIKATKDSIKKGIKASNELMYQHTKNIIEKCWDKDSKEFIKPDKIEQKVFDIVKNIKNQGQWKKALKYGGITAGVLGALTLAYKILIPSGMPKFNQPL